MKDNVINMFDTVKSKDDLAQELISSYSTLGCYPYTLIGEHETVANIIGDGNLHLVDDGMEIDTFQECIKKIILLSSVMYDSTVNSFLQHSRCECSCGINDSIDDSTALTLSFGGPDRRTMSITVFINRFETINNDDSFNIRTVSPLIPFNHKEHVHPTIVNRIIENVKLLSSISGEKVMLYGDESNTYILGNLYYGSKKCCVVISLNNDIYTV